MNLTLPRKVDIPEESKNGAKPTVQQSIHQSLTSCQTFCELGLINIGLAGTVQALHQIAIDARSGQDLKSLLIVHIQIHHSVHRSADVINNILGSKGYTPHIHATIAQQQNYQQRPHHIISEKWLTKRLTNLSKARKNELSMSSK